MENSDIARVANGWDQKAEGFPGQHIVVIPRRVVERMERHPLLTGLMPTDIGIFPNAKGHFFERKKGISAAIFIHCLKGGGWCEIRSKRHNVGPGDLLVVQSDEPHRYGANEEEPWTILWFHVTGGEVRLLLGELGVTSERSVVYLGDEPRLPALFEDALTVLEHGYTPFQLIHASRILGCLIGFMIARSREKWRDQPNLRQKITSCITYMKEHIDKNLTLANVATVANLSPSYFNVIFRKETGYPCMDYLTRLRIHQACQWLDTTDLPVKTIAARLAFHDPLYFSRVFASIQGVPPKEYRRMHKG